VLRLEANSRAELGMRLASELPGEKAPRPTLAGDQGHLSGSGVGGEAFATDLPPSTQTVSC
jgi:hypothetical protein